MIRVDLVRTGWGLWQLAGAEHIARAELGHDPDAVTTWALRVLGSRQIVQGAILSMTHSRTAHRLGGVVDILHAVSMVLVAATSRERRLAAVIDGVTAGCFAFAELRR